MYPIYCINPTGRTNYISQPISLENNDCEGCLLCWENFLQNVQRICFFQPFHISQCLHTNHGIFLLFHSNNVHHGVFVLRELHFCFMNGCLWWIPFIKIWWNLLSHNGRYIFIYFLVPIRMHDRKILLKSFGYAENVTQLIHQKNFISPDKKTNILRCIKYISSVMTQKMPPYLDKRYPP